MTDQVPPSNSPQRGEKRTSPPGGGTEGGDVTLVIGLGNPLRGDDGVGVRVAQMLATQALPPDVEVLDGGTQGLGLVNLMEGRRRVILVDAADVGRAPGEFVRFTPDEARLLGDEAHLSVHAGGLRDALLLAQALQVLPDEVIIFGVQPARLEWDSALSPEIEATLPDLITAVLGEIVDGG
jgi:hydrogenase maturation protease